MDFPHFRHNEKYLGWGHGVFLRKEQLKFVASTYKHKFPTASNAWQYISAALILRLGQLT